MLGLKYYGNLNLEVLVDLLFEYGTITRPQYEKIIAGYELREVEVMSVLMKLRRHQSICVLEPSHILNDLKLENPVLPEKFYAADFVNHASIVSAVEKVLWVLIDYLFEVDYHFCCTQACRGLGPSVAFGHGNGNYEIFYIRQGQEEFFNSMIDAHLKELFYNTRLAQKENKMQDKRAETLLDTRFFLVLDAEEQIPLLEAEHILSYCLIQPDYSVRYITAEETKQ